MYLYICDVRIYLCESMCVYVRVYWYVCVCVGMFVHVSNAYLDMCKLMCVRVYTRLSLFLIVFILLFHLLVMEENTSHSLCIFLNSYLPDCVHMCFKYIYPSVSPSFYLLSFSLSISMSLFHSLPLSPSLIHNTQSIAFYIVVFLGE